MRIHSASYRSPKIIDLHLFLGSLGLSRILRTLLAGTGVAGNGASVAEGAVGTTLNLSRHVSLLDLLDGGVDLGDGEDGGEGSLGELGGVGLGVTLLGGVGLAGKENETLLVGLEAGDVQGETLLGEVLAAEVDGDADGGSNETGDTGLL